MAKILVVVGTRPNFVKVAPLMHALDTIDHWSTVLVHTGQHYDTGLSGVFFDNLSLRRPDRDLGVGSGSHGVQTARVLMRMEKVLRDEQPDLVVVVGDVNSTLAAALAAVKLHLPVAHVEAGLRSGDRAMPEEINRILTDQLSDLCLTPSLDANENLLREGISEERIHFVGNIMIDSLLSRLETARSSGFREGLGLSRNEYIVATLHRPSNVDDPSQLSEIMAAFRDLASNCELVLPLHPRTEENLKSFDIPTGRIRTMDPLGYLEMLDVMEGARLVLTDSGGIQEETTVLGVPCLTLRDSTERPITVTSGTNRLVPDRSRDAIIEAVAQVRDSPHIHQRPEGWDGKTAMRIVDIFEKYFAR